MAKIGDEEVLEEIMAEPEIEGTEYWNWFYDLLVSSTTGWLMLALVGILFMNWNRIHNFLDRLYEKSQQREYDAKCHKDPDWVMSNYERMDIARRKMQDRYNVQAADYKIKSTEKERQKNMEKLTKASSTLGSEGHRLGSGENYSPLMGDSSGRFKPQKKSKCSGGGCG